MKRSIPFFLVFMFFICGLSACNNLTTNLPTTTSSETELTTIQTEDLIQVTFNSMNGSSVEPVYVLRGSTITIPSVSREGYTLEGWYTSVNEGVTFDEKWSFLSNKVDNEITLYAKWDINQYKIDFDTNEGSSVGTITQDYNTVVQEPLEPVKEGNTFSGWYQDSELTEPYIFSLMPAEDITLYAKWSINQYTISFETNGGSIISMLTEDYGSVLSEPSVPTKLGYSFSGWYLDQEFSTHFLFGLMPAENLTLYAKWDVIDYDITYNLSGGTNTTNPETYNINQDTIHLTEATKTGYTFGGWYLNPEYTGESITQISSGSTGNLTLYAKWAINQYTVSFESNEGSHVESITQDYNTVLEEPIVPFKQGYSFEGWYLDSELSNIYTFLTMPAEDITLYAKWNLIFYSISYNLDGGSNSTNPYSYSIVTNTITLNDPTKEGYSFSGWYDNPEFNNEIVTEIELGSTGDIYLYAKWAINQYSVYYQIIENLPLEEGETIIQVSLGDSHSAVLTSNNRVFIWGRNTYGQLGDGTSQDKNTPVEITSQFSLNTGETIISLSLGWFVSAAITSEGRVFTWGYNSNGQLGNGLVENSFIPLDITSQFNLASGEKIAQISFGWMHAAAITTENRLFTWGGNNHGQLGDGTYTSIWTPKDITSQISLDVGETFTKIDLGYFHSGLLTSEGRVFTWGYNYYGQLGNGTMTQSNNPIDITSQFSLSVDDEVIDLSLGDSHTAIITLKKRVFAWGRNNYGQLGDNVLDQLSPMEITSKFTLDTLESFVQINLGRYHSSLLTSEGRIYTWGYNLSGQLGDGTNIDKSTPVEITSQINLLSTEVPIQISLGGSHSSVLVQSGKIFTWGYNTYGQLGDGTTTSSNLPVETKYFTLLFEDIYDYNSLQTEYEPVLEGYTFSGWFIDLNMTTLYSFNVMPAYDLVLYGEWIKNT